MWGLCAILTATDVFDEGDPSRTDTRMDILTDATWFRVPYPRNYLFTNHILLITASLPIFRNYVVTCKAWLLTRNYIMFSSMGDTNNKRCWSFWNVSWGSGLRH